MKIQELLTKHKDNLFHKDVSEIEYIKWIVFGYELDVKRLMPHTKFSLSDLLFSTPFLSLLEWKKNDFESYMQNWNRICDDFNIHKINLVLLDTDEERIKYIEEFTL
jgi:hypothetical protein